MKNARTHNRTRNHELPLASQPIQTANERKMPLLIIYFMSIQSFFLTHYHTYLITYLNSNYVHNNLRGQGCLHQDFLEIDFLVVTDKGE